MARRIWIFHDNNPGDTNSARALAAAMGESALEINVANFVEDDKLTNAFRALPPEPYPYIALSPSNAYGCFCLRALKVRNPQTLTVQLGYQPVGAAGFFDRMFYFPVLPYPPHPRAYKTCGALTLANEARLLLERKQWHETFSEFREPRVAVLCGTRAVHCAFPPNFFETLLEHLRMVGNRNECSFLICTNRRTSPEQVRTLTREFPSPKHFVYHPTESRPNPYWGAVAHASAFIVTCDSLSMLSDAIATGKPVFAVGLNEALRGNWRWFFEDLVQRERIQAFHGDICLKGARTHPPLDEAQRMATLLKEAFFERFGIPWQPSGDSTIGT